jgi:hypothetical protein
MPFRLVIGIASRRTFNFRACTSKCTHWSSSGREKLAAREVDEFYDPFNVTAV